MDEWIAVGDAKFLKKAERRLQCLVDRSSILVIASHSPDLIKRLCNKAILLYQRQAMAIGTVDEVLEQYTAAA